MSPHLTFCRYSDSKYKITLFTLKLHVKRAMHAFLINKVGLIVIANSNSLACVIIQVRKFECIAETLVPSRNVYIFSCYI